MNDSEIAPTLDITAPGELPITPELKSAFLSSLAALNLTIRFFSGSWSTFNPAATMGSDCYNVILTSETIYQMDSLESLVDVMEAACIGTTTKESLNGLFSSSLSISEKSAEEDTFGALCPYQCLVAAKVLYFGVGGGVLEFLKWVERRKGLAITVQERKVGVGRKVIRVKWTT
jgi:protein-histidine N-methyltransferase